MRWETIGKYKVMFSYILVYFPTLLVTIIIIINSHIISYRTLELTVNNSGLILLDVSGNTKLGSLTCMDNYLDEIDLDSSGRLISKSSLLHEVTPTSRIKHVNSIKYPNFILLKQITFFIAE